MAATLAKVAGKVGIAVGAVAVTASQGVWSANTESASKALNSVRTNVPTANEMFEKIPSREDVRNAGVQKWNSGVMTVFSGMAVAPEKSVKFVTEKIKDLQK